MVSLEFEKPSDWSIGKKIAAIAMIFLIIGAFLSYSLCLPIVSIALIVFLLYLKFDIYLEKKDETRIKINHFILILWGAWFLVSNLLLLIMLLSFNIIREFFPRIFLIGIGLTVVGFFLCILAGLLEWRYPRAAGPGVSKASPSMKKKEKPTVEEASAPATVVAAQPESQKRVPVTTLREESTKVVAVKPGPSTTEAHSVSDKVEIPTREMSPEEYKNLLRWVNHIDKNGQAFEQCMKCQNYVFMKATKTPDAIVFTCPECNEVFLYKK